MTQAEGKGADAPATGEPARVAFHRSKGVVERNLPRWFRGQGFKPWDDFFSFLEKDAGVKADAELLADHQALVARGDDATPKGLQRLIRYYNRKRRFSKSDLAPPWLFVEGATRPLPPDDGWTIEVAVELDRGREKEKAEGPKDAAAPASTGPALTDEGAYVTPPAADKQWAEALRRLPPAARLLCDGRGKSPGELNERRRLALKLNDFDRELSRERTPQDLRRSLIEWAAQARAKDMGALRAEAKRREDAVKAWVEEQAAKIEAKNAGLDETARAELRARLPRDYPTPPDDARVQQLVRAAIASANPKRRAEWAKKVIDDWNASRGNMSERVRDPGVIAKLTQWLVQRDDDETPTDGEIYDHLEKLGIRPIKKRRPEGPRRPREPERKQRHPNEDEEEPKPAAAKGQKGAKGPKGEKAEKGEQGEPKPADAPPAPEAEAPKSEPPPA